MIRVLDIGCDLGHGMAALAEVPPAEERLIVGTDENPKCLIGAAERLGLDPAHPALCRLATQRLPSDAYEVTIPLGRMPALTDMALVQSDLMIEDRQLETWLDGTDAFDAVTLWFTGFHKTRSLLKVIERLEITGDADHRTEMENRVIDLGLRRFGSEEPSRSPPAVSAKTSRDSGRRYRRTGRRISRTSLSDRAVLGLPL